MKAVMTVSRDIQVLRVRRRAVPDETAWQDWAHFTDTEEELAAQSLFGKQAAHKEVQDSIVVTHGSQRESEQISTPKWTTTDPGHPIGRRHQEAPAAGD